MARDVGDTGNYLEKLYKIIPTELTAAYVAISAFLVDDVIPDKNNYLLFGFGVFLTILTPLYLYRLQNVTHVLQLIVSTVSFPIWAVTISTSLVVEATSLLTTQIITVVMVAWVLVTPLIVPSQP